MAEEFFFWSIVYDVSLAITNAYTGTPPTIFVNTVGFFREQNVGTFFSFLVVGGFVFCLKVFSRINFGPS